MSEAEKENISALAQLAVGLAVAAGTGGNTNDVGTAVSGSKNAVENNNMNGFAPVIGINNADGANLDSIRHAYANGYLTQEQATQASKNQLTGIGLNAQATELAELWMRAPAQIGQQLPGPLGLGMAALSMGDGYLTGTDKANLISLINKASGDYLSGSDSFESMAALSSTIHRLGLGNLNNQYQGLIKDKVETNVNNTQKGNNASSFDEHAAKDNAPTLKETTDGGTLIFHENIGGHTITKLVGKTDEQLLARFDLEPNIKASSTFKDAYTADKAIGSGILSNEEKISNWMKNSDETRLIIQHEVNFELGNVIYKGETKSHTTKKLVIVVDKDPLSYSGYRVHTAYPK